MVKIENQFEPINKLIQFLKCNHKINFHHVNILIAFSKANEYIENYKTLMKNLEINKTNPCAQIKVIIFSKVHMSQKKIIHSLNTNNLKLS